MERYQFFDHTGDFGVDVWAEREEQVFAVFARAYLELFCGSAAAVRELEEREIEIDGFDREDQLVALGNELIYLFDAEGFLCSRLDLDGLDDDGFSGVAYGETYDPERHPIERPVKAVTHHGAVFDASSEPPGWHARIVFDL